LKYFSLAFENVTPQRLNWSEFFLITCNSGDFSVLVHLDLTTAFDTIDHTILIDRLKNCVGIGDSALKWLISFYKVNNK